MTSFLASLPPSILKKKARTPEQLVTAVKSSIKFVLSANSKKSIYVDVNDNYNIESSNNSAVKTSEIDSDERSAEVELDKISRCLEDIKNVLYGEPSSLLSSNPVAQFSDGKASELRYKHEEEIIQETSRCLQSSNLILLLIENFSMLPFESRKSVALIFNSLMKRDSSLAEYLLQQEHRVAINHLIGGYTDPDIALSCGSMIRESIRHDSLALYVLNNSELFDRFFDEFVCLPNFDVASDAFGTLKELLTTPNNRRIASEFMEEHYERVFVLYEVFWNC